MQSVKHSAGNVLEQINTLEREKELALSYLDIAGVMIVVLNKKGMIKMVNNKACEVLGYTKNEITGKNWFQNFLPAHNACIVQKRFNDLMEGKEPAEYNENSVLTKDKQERLISWHTSFTKDSNGKINGIVSSGDDITERRKTE